MAIKLIRMAYTSTKLKWRRSGINLGLRLGIVVVHSFLGLASYYRRPIKNFAKIAGPLTEKTTEKVEFEWNNDMTLAYGKLKETLCASHVLLYPTYKKPFIVSTDASSRAVFAVLSQLDDDSRKRPIQ